MYIGLIALAAVLRLAWLDHIPPGLWYDEAIYALDGLDVAHGKFRIFFDTEGHMREPLYIYSLGAMFAAVGSSVLHARIVSALWGTLTVAMFFPLARRFFGNSWGLLATFAFTVFRWHVHFSRTIFRALLPPLFILLVFVFWFRWRERKRIFDAWLCGILLGAGMYTYLSFRLVPIILAGMVAWETARRRLLWRSDWKGLAAIAAGSLITFAPLGIDYLRNPVHFTGRTSEVSMFEKTITVKGPDGVEHEQQVRKTTSEAIRDLSVNALDIARMWTVKGDHVGKHNLPYAPVFDWASGCIFYLGLLWCLLHFTREPFAFLTLLWIAVLSLTSIFSFGAPNLLRMQGMTPAVVIAYIAGLRWLSVLMATRVSRPVRIGTLSALVALYAGVQLYVYFVKFPASVAVRREFTADIFYAPAEGVRDVSSSAAYVWVPQELADTATFRFVIANTKNLRAYTAAENLTSSTLNGDAVLMTVRSLELAREAGHDQLAEVLTNTHTRVYRTFTLPVEGPRDLEAGIQKWGEIRTGAPTDPHTP
jgi:4-amino-4-deoxy-L-arabinose transferase-like glycosyltransferase